MKKSRRRAGVFQAAVFEGGVDLALRAALVRGWNARRGLVAVIGVGDVARVGLSGGGEVRQRWGGGALNFGGESQPANPS